MSFKNIGKSLNLPSQECYNIIQDKRGYIWICTDNGLCRYSGNSLKIFNKNNGLPERSIYFIKEDKAGDIWLITSENRVLKVINDSLVEQNCTGNLKKSFQFSLETCYTLNFDDKNDLIINSRRSTYKIDRRSFKSRVLQYKAENTTDAHYTIVEQTNENYLIKNSELINQPFNPRSSSYHIDVNFAGKHQATKIIIPFQNFDFPDWRVKVCKINGTTFFNVHNRLIKVNRDLSYSIYILPSKILSLYADKHDGLYVGVFQKGLYYYKNIHQMDEVIKTMDEYSVTGTLLDAEGSLWCTTLEKDVFYCNNKDLIDYTNIKQLQKPASLLKYMNGNLYISTEYDRFMILGKDSIKHINISYGKNCGLTDVSTYKNNIYLSSQEYLIKTDDTFKRLKKTENEKEGYKNVGIYYTDTCKGKLYGLGYLITVEIKNDTAKNLPVHFSTGPKCMLFINDSIMYAGRADGLYMVNIKNFFAIKSNGISSPVTKVIKTRGGQIYAATKSEGLFRIEAAIATKIHFPEIISTEIFTDMEEDRYENLWISSDKGVFKIIKQNDVIKCYKFNATKGLLSDNVMQIAVDTGLLYMSTSEGLCAMPLTSDLINETPPPIYINALNVNNQPFNFNSDELVFPYHQNSINIIFDALTFKDGGKCTLMYKFTEQDDAFKLADQNELIFNNLEPDTYELTVYAINNDGIKSQNPVKIKFEILKPFWRTWWFIISCVLIIMLTGAAMVYQKIQKVKIKEEEKTLINRQISESQLSALQAQMNPHFIFNAINSIQNYILKNDEQAAYNYLAKFSKLIRMVLNNSRETILPIHAELQTLNIYIELEQLRFKNSFDYKLLINDDVDEYTLSIPTMLIQPYVENAIWHGLMNLTTERRGVLKIEITKKLDFLKIIIEDNGIGRKKSNELKKENLHNPIALKLTEQRLSIIKSMGDYKEINVSIIDLYDTYNNACGTRVVLLLPVINLI